MTFRLPLIPTLIVAAAVGTMIALGLWQLGRADTKTEQLALYQAAAAASGAVRWPITAQEAQQALYRQSAFDCAQVLAVRETAGRSVEGQTGWAHIARCRLAEGGEAEVALGWSHAPGPVGWTGGRVSGLVGPAGEGVRLVAAPPQAGLAPLTAPDPRDIPNNHLSYAGQWFFFALAAMIIYILALRRRQP